MASSVATPLEQQLSQIPGVTQLTSSSALGYTQLTVEFELSRTVDSAAVTGIVMDGRKPREVELRHIAIRDGRLS